jgi:DNA polymerase III subunit gamma/tau
MLGGAQPQRREGLSTGDAPSAPRDNAPLNQAPGIPAQSLADLGAFASDGEPESEWDEETAGDVPLDDQPVTAPQFATVRSFGDVVSLVGQKRDVRLKIDLEENVSLVKFDAATNSIDLFLLPAAAPAVPNELREKLNRWTNRKWVIVLSKAKGEPTLGDTRRAREAKDREILEQHPAIAALRTAFPEAKLTGIRTPLIQRGDEDDETATG